MKVGKRCTNVRGHPLSTLTSSEVEVLCRQAHIEARFVDCIKQRKDHQEQIPFKLIYLQVTKNPTTNSHSFSNLLYLHLFLFYLFFK